MSDDIFQDIYGELKKVNEKLLTLDVDLVSALQGTQPTEPTPPKTSKPKKEDTKLEKVFGWLRQFGKSNPITNFADAITKHAQTLSETLAEKVKPEATAIKSVAKVKPIVAPPVQTPLAQTVAQTLAQTVTKTPTAPPIIAKAAKAPNATPVQAAVTQAPVAATGLMASFTRLGATVGRFATGLIALIPGIGQVAAGIGVAVAVFAGLATAVVSMTKSFLDGQKELAKFNAKLALTFAQSKWRQIRRDIDTANNTAAGTVNLNNAHEDFKDAWLPITQAISNLKTLILTPLMGQLTNIVRVVAVPFQIVNKLVDSINKYVGPLTSILTQGLNLFSPLLRAINTLSDLIQKIPGFNGGLKPAQLGSGERFFLDVSRGKFPQHREAMPIK